MKYIKAVLSGAAAGALINNLILLGMSYALNLGYFAPCLTGIAEPLGGELNGAAVELACAMAAGACIALALHMGRRYRCLVRLAVCLAGMLPSAMLLSRLTMFI